MSDTFFFPPATLSVNEMSPVVRYLHTGTGAVRQERTRTLLTCFFERELVAARSRGFLNLDKVLVGPGRQAVLLKPPLYLVGQGLVAARTGPVILRGILAVGGRNKG